MSKCVNCLKEINEKEAFCLTCHEEVLGCAKNQIANLEAKLEEKSKENATLEAMLVENANDRKTMQEFKIGEDEYDLTDEDARNSLCWEVEELKQQLAEKRCEICGSKMILGELGYYCNNDELHPIYQAPNEAKSGYEKITLLKQDYDAMVEREELLRQQLEEKEKEIETKNSINNLYKATVSLRDNDFKDLVYENNSLKQQLNSQPAEIVEKIKNYKGEYFEWKIGDKIYPAFKITEEDLDNIFKEYQK